MKREEFVLVKTTARLPDSTETLMHKSGMKGKAASKFFNQMLFILLR